MLGSLKRTAGAGASLRAWARFTIPFVFLASVVAAAVITIPAFRVSESGFNHSYPSDPTGAGRAPVGVPVAPAPGTDVIVRVTISSLSQLAGVLPPRALVRRAGVWRLGAPLVLAEGARLMLHGPHVLLLRRGSYIEVAQTATASLTDMELKGIGPRRSRPFLLALGGRLLLAHDDLLGLGRLSSMAYGISFVAAAAGSGVLHSVVSDDLTGIYATDTSGLRIEDNQISNSEVDGVELHDAVTAAVVNGNLVATSGLHDIVLGVNVTRTAVVHDTVSGAEEHGIVLYDGASNDRVVADTVRGCLDGIVIADASRNEIHGNLVSARRFALRISGRSRHNRVTGNIFSRSLIGAYITRGPADNRLLANTYRSDRENVRIRAGSPGNVVRPIPAASELWSH